MAVPESRDMLFRPYDLTQSIRPRRLLPRPDDVTTNNTGRPYDVITNNTGRLNDVTRNNTGRHNYVTTNNTGHHNDVVTNNTGRPYDVTNNNTSVNSDLKNNIICNESIQRSSDVIQSVDNLTSLPPNTEDSSDCPIGTPYKDSELQKWQPSLRPTVDPPYSTPTKKKSLLPMVSEAILKSHQQMATISEIYEFLEKNFKSYTKLKSNWRNNVRYTLSIHGCFIKGHRAGSRGHYWYINPHLTESFQNGDYNSRQRAQRPYVRKKTKTGKDKIMEMLLNPDVSELSREKTSKRSKRTVNGLNHVEIKQNDSNKLTEFSNVTERETNGSAVSRIIEPQQKTVSSYDAPYYGKWSVAAGSINKEHSKRAIYDWNSTNLSVASPLLYKPPTLLMYMDEFTTNSENIDSHSPLFNIYSGASINELEFMHSPMNKYYESFPHQNHVPALANTEWSARSLLPLDGVNNGGGEGSSQGNDPGYCGFESWGGSSSLFTGAGERE